MSEQEPDPTLGDFSPVTAGARALFGFVKWLSPMQWLGRLGRRRPQSWLSLFRSRSELTQDEVHSKDFTRRRARAVETYMAVWLGLELAVVSMSCLGPWATWLSVLFVVVVVSRIGEVIQVTVNATLFDALSGRSDECVASRSRMIVLAGVNFIELCVCYGVIYAADYAKLRGAGTPITAFYFSVITQLTIGYGDVFPVGWLRLVAAAQGLTGILFVVLVFGRFMAALPQGHSIFGEKQS